MTEYISCPQCGTAQPAQQKFCGECRAALREGVTRPLTTDERIMLEGRARLAARSAGDSQTQAESGREPVRRPLLINGLLLGFVLLLLAGAGFGLSGLVAGQRSGPPEPEVAPMLVNAEATPTDFRLIERGHSAKLGPGIVITFTQFTVQPGSAPQLCPNGLSFFWSFDMANTNQFPANVVGDPDSLRVVDSTGRIYPLGQQCGAKFASSFTQPIIVSASYPASAYISTDVYSLSAAATYLDLHMLISGTHYAFRTPLP